MISVKKFVQNRFNELHRQYDQCTAKLMAQVSFYPSSLNNTPLDRIDQQLEEFVQIQQKYVEQKLNGR